jgi:hypothetical protein
VSKPTVERLRAQFHEDEDAWWGDEYDRLKESLDELLRVHAHELAEHQRAELARLVQCGYPGSIADRVIDLIDPEVPK